MKTINELLNEKNPNRYKQLINLVPEVMDGEKIYYNKRDYFYYSKKDNKLYSGTDSYIKDSEVMGNFPLIFFLEALYLGRDFAEKYKEIPELNSNKSLELNKHGLVELKDYGTVANKHIIRVLLEESKYDKEEAS